MLTTSSIVFNILLMVAYLFVTLFIILGISDVICCLATLLYFYLLLLGIILYLMFFADAWQLYGGRLGRAAPAIAYWSGGETGPPAVPFGESAGAVCSPVLFVPTFGNVVPTSIQPRLALSLDVETSPE